MLIFLVVWLLDGALDGYMEPIFTRWNGWSIFFIIMLCLEIGFNTASSTD